MSLEECKGAVCAANPEAIAALLDGNGERDSQTFTFTVPDGQGEVWMQFDQG